MAEGGGGGGGGALDPSKLAQCYAKLFQRQQAFAAEQADVFAKLAAGDEATMTAVLKLQVAKVGGADGDQGGKGKKRKNMKRDPDAPKRPKTGYQFFVCERTPVLKAAQPDAKMTDLMSVLANDWKQLTDEEKEKYQKQAVTAKSAYQDSMATYKAGNGGGGGGGGGGGAKPAKAAVPKTKINASATDAPAKEAEDDDEDDEHDDTESDTAAEEVKKSKKKKKKKHKHHHSDKPREES